MSDLFKLTFTPIVNGYENMDKYKVKVEYFNNNIIGSKFDMRDKDGLGAVVFFINDFIDVTEYYLEGYCGETRTSRSLLDNDFIIKWSHIDGYIEAINKVKPQLEELCMEKQKEEECRKKLWDAWLQKKPIEYSF